MLSCTGVSRTAPARAGESGTRTAAIIGPTNMRAMPKSLIEWYTARTPPAPAIATPLPPNHPARRITRARSSNPDQECRGPERQQETHDGVREVDVQSVLGKPAGRTTGRQREERKDPEYEVDTHEHRENDRQLLGGSLSGLRGRWRRLALCLRGPLRRCSGFDRRGGRCCLSHRSNTDQQVVGQKRDREVHRHQHCDGARGLVQDDEQPDVGDPKTERHKNREPEEEPSWSRADAGHDGPC